MANGDKTGDTSSVSAIKAWHRLFGEVPAARAFDGARARGNWRLEEFRRVFKNVEGAFPPHVATVQRQHGSWNAAIEAAGFVPRESDGSGKPRETETASA